MEGPPETSHTLQHCRIEGIKGVPDLGTKGNGILVFSVIAVRAVREICLSAIMGAPYRRPLKTPQFVRKPQLVPVSVVQHYTMIGQLLCRGVLVSTEN